MVQLQEFRIVLPMTVEEFKRGMRYSNWKTNEQQTQEGQGGQLLSSSPFYDEQYGEGTFSHSVYRLGDRLPDWVTKLVPANALVIDEKTWSTFPYLRTVMTCPFFSKLRIEVHSIHLDDDGSDPNALNLDPEELAQRKIDYMDILMDKVAKRDYRPDQDPGLVASKLTGLGPLKPGWQKTASPTMCAYKVVKAYCGYWGVQNRAEKFICKGVRDIFLLTHRNCFCWLDLWYGLSFEQIIQLESFGRQKMKSAVKQPDIIDPKTGKPMVIEDDAASVASSQDAPRGKLRDRKGEEDRRGERRRIRRDDSWESGSETGGPRSSVDEESDTSDMEAEFYEALMEWGSPEDSEPEPDMGVSFGLRNSFRLTVSPDSASVPEDERCQVCAQGRGGVSRASFACETCGEIFCAACFGEWHVTTKLRTHKRTALKFKDPVASAEASSRRPSTLAVGESQAEPSTSSLVTASSVPIPIASRSPLGLDRATSQPPATAIKPHGDSGKPPIAAYGRSNSGGSRAVTEEYKDRGALVEEIERLKSNGADLTDVRVAETVLELYDFGRPQQTAPWMQEKTSAPLNTPVSEPASTSGRNSPRRSPSSHSLESLGAVSPAPRSPLQISQDMLRAIMTVYLAGGQHRQANGDPYGVRVNNAVDDIGAYKATVELLTIKGEAGVMMESKAFLKFRILAELLIDAELRDLSHEEKLAFWINVYNTLLLHAYLVNGLPKSHVKRIFLMQRACYHIGGLVYSSLQIEHSILRAQSFRPALAGLLPVHRFKSGDPRGGMALSRPEPLVSFALCSGCRSGPALRVYSAESIAEQLETAARDFLRAAVGFSRSKVLVPKIMHWYANDFSTDAASLLDWVASKVTDNQAQAIRERLLGKKGHGSKCMDVQSYQWDFRYLILQEPQGQA